MCEYQFSLLLILRRLYSKILLFWGTIYIHVSAGLGLLACRYTLSYLRCTWLRVKLRFLGRFIYMYFPVRAFTRLYSIDFLHVFLAHFPVHKATRLK